MVPRVAHLLAVVVAISSTARCSAAAAVPLCSEQEVQGKQSFVSGACIWPPNPAQPSQPAVQLEGTAAGFFPRIVLRPEGSSTPGNASKHEGFNLSMKRLFLLNATLSAPSQGPGPKLLPLGLFSTAPTNLSMMDVRLAVGPAAFQQYLAFFSKYLRAVRTKDDGGVGMHTDGVSFLNVPYWSDANTELYSVTLMSGPCIPPASQSFNTALSWLATAPGCNVRLVTNDTLVPTLLRDATVNTTQPLLVRLVTNVSLGVNLQQPIVFRRPVLLVGTSSTPISVDLGMVVNQLDVSAETAQLAWQAVVLENLAPGDAITSIMAPPYSITVSMNVWAVYCNRSRDMCLPLTNVTLVIPSQDEISYLTFMATMFNSPSPSLRQLADFYITDLKMTKFEVQPTSNNDILTVLFLVTNAWQMWYVVMQTQPVFAPKLGAPRQVFNQLQYRTGVLVQAIRDCSSFQATQGFAPNRVHVWQLVDDVSIGGPNCTWSSPINVTGPTTLFGEVASQGTAPSMRSYLQVAAPTGMPAGPAASREVARNATNPGADQSSIFTGIATSGTVNTLSFQYTEGLINLPADAPDRYFQIRNITLRQLPQAHGMHRDGSGRHSHGVERGRRLMQEPAPPVMGGLAAMPSDTHPELFTMLLWPFNRTLSGSPLLITDSQLMLPQPEWDLIAQAARSARHFAIGLDGSANLLFTGVTLVDSNILTAEAYVGPGILANRVRLLPDPAAASAHPLYYWPMSAAAASAGQSSRLSPAAQAGVGVAVAVVGVLVLAAAATLAMRRRKRRQAHRALLEDKRLLQQGAVHVLPLAGNGTVPGIGGVAGGSAGPALLAGSVPLNSKGSAGLLRGLSNSDINLLSEQNQHPHGHGSSAAAAAIAGNGAAATAAEACAALRTSSARGSDRLLVCGSTVGTDTAATCTAGSTVTPLGISPRLSSAAELELSIAQGLKNWNDAVSLQTMQLMQHRLQASSMRCYQRQFTASTTTLSSSQGVSMAGRQAGQTDVSVAASAAAAAAAAGDNSMSSSARSSNNDRHDDLQLFEVIGNGSFGAVHLGSWRGKQVAVKVMHLPAQAFQKDQQHMLLQMSQQQQNPAQQRLQQQKARMQQQNSRPHMAIMEAVLSTNLHHPNVVQVYTFMLNPLTAQRKPGANSVNVSRRASLAEPLDLQQQQQQGEEAADKQEAITGWTLQLVMEYCDQGTLRDQLDNHTLPHLPHSSQLDPAVAVALSHDIAAAMLHLHREGIVHGDLKAGNVLLQASTAVRAGSMAQKQALLQAWMAAGCLPLTAKVADFGLALPLGHTDTHATLLARGTPSHMGPEVFMSGHISKASDVYAFGVLLYEIATGQRAYAGIAVPLLPHRVAVEGLRPVWPSGVMADLRRLAESCWAQKPQQRPNFQDILAALERIEVGPGQQAAAALVPTPPSLAAQGGQQANVVQAAAAAAESAHPAPGGGRGVVDRPAPPLPPRHNKPQQQQQQQVQQHARQQQQQQVQQHARQQQQQQQVQQHAVAEPEAGAAGLFAGATPGNNTGGNKEGLDWSEVSYGRPSRYVGDC